MKSPVRYTSHKNNSCVQTHTMATANYDSFLSSNKTFQQSFKDGDKVS